MRIYPSKITIQAEQAGILSLTGTTDATQALVSRFRPPLWPVSAVLKYLKLITQVKRTDTHSPSGATNATPALEQSPGLTLQQVSKSRLAEHSTDAQAAYKFIHDALELGSRRNLNMASYGNYWPVDALIWSISFLIGNILILYSLLIIGLYLDGTWGRQVHYGEYQ